MFWYRTLLCLLQFAALASLAQAQDDEYIRAHRKFNAVDLYSGKTVDIDGEKTWLFRSKSK